MRARVSRAAAVIVLAVAAVTFGCGQDRRGGPGPGGATISGNVSDATTASVAAERRSWLAWLGESVLGFARSAYAQAQDGSLGGITVIVRGEGREVSDLTATTGNFVVIDAPTGDTTVLFRRGGCEASMPLGDVISNSSVILADTSFVCTGSSGTVSPGDVSEQFEGVIRDTPDDPADVDLCVRHGDNDDNRSISVFGADIEDQAGFTSSFADLERHDLVQVTGLRADPENDSPFDTIAVQIVRRNVTDDCEL